MSRSAKWLSGPSGRSDAGAVLDPKRFAGGPIRHAYRITDPGRIQPAVDRAWAPEGTELWQPLQGA